MKYILFEKSFKLSFFENYPLYYFSLHVDLRNKDWASFYKQYIIILNIITSILKVTNIWARFIDHW